MTPLVLLHGFTGTPATFDAFLERWRTPLPPLVQPVLLGHDGTPSLDAPDSFLAEVARLAAIVAKTTAKRGYLVGYSLGARLALGLLVHHRSLFVGATLLGTNPGLSDPAARAQRVEADQQWRQLLGMRGIEAFVETWSTQPLFASQERLPPCLLRNQARERTRHHPEGLRRSLAVTGLGVMPPFWNALGKVEVPVEVVAGALDVKFLALARHMASLLPRGRLHVAPDAGHNLLLECPELIVGIVEAGMARCSR